MKNALDYFTISREIYKDDLEQFHDLGYRDVYQVISDNDYGLVLADDNTLVVCFRGSDDIKDWLDNLDLFSKYDSRFGWVHGGFLEAFKDIFPKIDTILSEIIHTYDRVIFTGHSKGGALAVLCSAYYSRFTDIELYTYGCPRVGKKDFVKRFKKLPIKHYRYVNGKDPVPTIPRAYMRYRHDSKPIKMKDGWWTFLWFGDISDHYTKNYKKSLEKIFKT